MWWVQVNTSATKNMFIILLTSSIEEENAFYRIIQWLILGYEGRNLQLYLKMIFIIKQEAMQS